MCKTQIDLDTNVFLERKWSGDKTKIYSKLARACERILPLILLKIKKDIYGIWILEFR